MASYSALTKCNGINVPSVIVISTRSALLITGNLKIPVCNRKLLKGAPAPPTPYVSTVVPKTFGDNL